MSDKVKSEHILMCAKCMKPVEHATILSVPGLQKSRVTAHCHGKQETKIIAVEVLRNWPFPEIEFFVTKH